MQRAGVTNGYSTVVGKCKTPAKDSNTIGTHEFVREVLRIIDKNTNSMLMLIRLISPGTLSKELCIWNIDTFSICDAERDQFMSAMTKDNRLIHAKTLLSKLNHRRPGKFWFSSQEKKK